MLFNKLYYFGVFLYIGELLLYFLEFLQIHFELFKDQRMSQSVSRVEVFVKISAMGLEDFQLSVHVDAPKVMREPEKGGYQQRVLELSQ
jgi:hypothetical protein